jgi:hypothetical protein
VAVIKAVTVKKGIDFEKPKSKPTPVQRLVGLRMNDSGVLVNVTVHVFFATIEYHFLMYLLLSLILNGGFCGL